MNSRNNVKSLISKNGRAVINQLKDFSHLNVQILVDLIQEDPLAGLLKDNDTGNNAYHLILDQNLRKEQILILLKALLQGDSDAKGLKAKNADGYLPLHMYVRQWEVDAEIVDLLLLKYPDAAKKENGQGMIPLFTCVMRETSSAHICKSLCRYFPDGPATMNKTHSYPLHFAARRSKPNKEILKILLRRFPTAATVANDFGLLPLHIIASGDDLAATRMIYEANKDAIKVCDRQGRTCLHIAVLSVGKDHASILAAEEEEYQLDLQRSSQRTQQDGGGGHVHNSKEREEDCYESDVEISEGIANGLSISNRRRESDILERQHGKSRAVVRFLLDCWPTALVMPNNFFSTPVETVLEKTKPMRSKKKVVSVFGLYDDPPTARLLLLAHCRFAQLGSLPPMKASHLEILWELNWLARKDALLVSFAGTRSRPIGAGGSSRGGKSGGTAGKKDSQTKHKDGKDSIINCGASVPIGKNNLLARFRDIGLVEIVRLIILLI